LPVAGDDLFFRLSPDGSAAGTGPRRHPLRFAPVQFISDPIKTILFLHLKSQCRPACRNPVGVGCQCSGFRVRGLLTPDT
jgi:hypothetical protein